MGIRVVVGLLAVVALAGCDREASRSATPEAPAGEVAPRTTVRAAGPVSRADAARCPVTRPRRWRPPAGVTRDALFGAGAAHGNGKLWVGGLWDEGVIEAGPEFVDAVGSIGMKFGWWREVEGWLRISGRRLDGSAPPLRADVPDGYDLRGFQASGVWFPTEGCWEVTGRVGATSLTFVTLVVERGAGR